MCWNCKDYIEDELHFLFNCPLYENLPVRAELLAFCTTINRAFDHLEYKEKWNFISQSENRYINLLFGKYVSEALKHRRKIIGNE